MANVVEVHADSKASPDAVWQLLADVTTWPSWSSFDETSYEREGDPPPHGLGAIRRLRVKKLHSRENVLAFDPPSHFAYDYDGSLPLKNYRGDVTLSPAADGSGGTHITWHSEFDTKVPGIGWGMRRAMKRVLTDISTALAKAAEQPQPQ
jgi:hypothetical protein